MVTVGFQHSPREKIFEAVIDAVEVKRVRDLSPRDIEHDNPEFRRVEETVHFLEQIYGREVSPRTTRSRSSASRRSWSGRRTSRERLQPGGPTPELRHARRCEPPARERKSRWRLALSVLECQAGFKRLIDGGFCT